MKNLNLIKYILSVLYKYICIFLSILYDYVTPNILFSKSKKPITRHFVLTNVWHYSSESETHTVETHIHRLRKKILEKFGDNNFIKNNKKGYYI